MVVIATKQSKLGLKFLKAFKVLTSKLGLLRPAYALRATAWQSAKSAPRNDDIEL